MSTAWDQSPLQLCLVQDFTVRVLAYNWDGAPNCSALSSRLASVASNSVPVESSLSAESAGALGALGRFPIC